ncbi:uncharacterized protein [Takifugu rubripes]|uniref:uncharacterized protein n=1 Tax=Takifugu rubripes TaxID=31033 RepID=UPI001145A6E5|nr:uncharacterized protein LOC115246842 [Takifugu rubripes]
MAEPEQIDEPDDAQVVQFEEPRRSERDRTLTEKGKEFHKEKTKGLLLRFDSIYDRWKALSKVAKRSVIKEDPSNILEHISTVQRELSELNIVYDEYRRIDSPEHEMCRKMDKCVSVTGIVVQNAQFQMQGTAEKIVWPDAGSVFASSVSSGSHSASKYSKANSVVSNVSSAKRQEAAAEYAATQAVLKIMAEQEGHQEKLQRLEVEDELIAADQEAAAVSRRLQAEKEETECKIERERKEAALLKQQEEESAARKRSVKDLKRELERLEELKRLNSARAKLQVYDEGEMLHNTELSTDMQATNQMNPVYQHTQSDSAPRHVVQDNSGELVKVLAEAISANRLPIPEPIIFSGDPLKFNHWKSSFHTLIERKNIPAAEKIFFLQKYVGGAAKEALEGYFLTDSEDSYHAAWDLLNERYGEPFVIAKALRDKLHAWSKIGPKESAELRKFVDFLRSCKSAMTHNESLNVLNDGIENQKLTAKLPDWLSTRWNRKATQYQLEHRRFPSFDYFVTFLSMEASIACNPITSYHALQQSESERLKVKNQTTVVFKNRTVGAKILTTNTSEKSIVTCVFCQKTGHSLYKCRRFIERPVSDRVKFIQVEKLCFGCLSHGHQSKSCSKRMVCDICSKRHPTCLHEDRLKHESKKENSEAQSVTKEITSNRVVQDSNNTQTSTIIPVYVSTSSDSSKEVLVYALLDSQSDSSFILEDVAVVLDVNSEHVKLKLSTMTSKKTVVTCKRLKYLQIRGLFSSKKITVPATYTREFIPANRSHIPTPETAKAWPHLMHLAEHIAPLMACEIGLLIGYNSPQALMPREVVIGEENQPFAQRTDLGWSIVSYGEQKENEIESPHHCKAGNTSTQTNSQAQE